MQLSIIHLAPYLPYGFKCEHNRKIDGKKIITEVGITNIAWLMEKDNFKPLLIPMSELNNPTLQWREIALDHAQSNNDEYIIMKDYNARCYLSYEFKMWLISYKFDVFHLIGEGLAAVLTEY